MAWAGMLYKELRFIIEDDLTEVYIAIEALGDSPLGVQGWHHKTFSKKYSVLDLMKMWEARDEKFGDPVLWEKDAPGN